ncbi:MAG: hypothetical protein IPG50_06760 [Myxococcales bacterium]|nr:hypothetical protein [Myxococcales bacterium]
MERASSDSTVTDGESAKSGCARATSRARTTTVRSPRLKSAITAARAAPPAPRTNAGAAALAPRRSNSLARAGTSVLSATTTPCST